MRGSEIPVKHCLRERPRPSCPPWGAEGPSHVEADSTEIRHPEVAYSPPRQVRSAILQYSVILELCIHDDTGRT